MKRNRSGPPERGVFPPALDLSYAPVIGLVVGIAPGAGGNIASMVSYSEATRWERDSHEFGKGTIRGVAASEAANSAMAPGSLIPLLTLGIPGPPPAAVILGALMLHGMQPGVELFSAHSSVVYAFIVGLAVAAVAVLILGILGSFVYARIVNIPSRALAPAILVLTVLGSFAISIVLVLLCVLSALMSLRALGVIVLAAVLVTAGLHALFQYVLMVPLPAGFWE